MAEATSAVSAQTRSVGEPRAGNAEILIDEITCRAPPEGRRSLGETVLSFGRFAIVLDLRGVDWRTYTSASRRRWSALILAFSFIAVLLGHGRDRLTA